MRYTSYRAYRIHVTTLASAGDNVGGENKWYALATPVLEPKRTALRHEGYFPSDDEAFTAMCNTIDEYEDATNAARSIGLLERERLANELNSIRRDNFAISIDDAIAVVLCSDNTVWSLDLENDSVWAQLPDIPRPARTRVASQNDQMDTVPGVEGHI